MDMDIDKDALSILTVKDEIRELVLLSARASDRMDVALLRSLYTKDGTHSSGPMFSGTADDFVTFLGALFSGDVVGHLGYSGHHVCNHLISIDDEDKAHGEVYVLAHQVMIPDKDTAVDLLLQARYLDHYRREDGRWRIASREVIFDHQFQRPAEVPEAHSPDNDGSYTILPGDLFARGSRRYRALADRFTASNRPKE